MVRGEAEPLDLDGLAILGMVAFHELTDEIPHDGVNILRNQAGAVFPGRKRLQLLDEQLGLVIHEQQLAGAVEEDDAGGGMLRQGLCLLPAIEL